MENIWICTGAVRAKLILGIETSCDETAVAVVKAARDGCEVLSNVIFSQIAVHKRFGGVVPEIASRNHMAKINQVTQEALDEAGVSLGDIEAIAVTYGPGLVGPLLVGVSFAKALSFATGIPLVGVHHIGGHISANYIEHTDLKPPFPCLVVSGGHTHLVQVEDYGIYRILGRTRDDAAGEAFDKVARVLGLSYPGGPEIERLAGEGNENAILFPKAKVGDAPNDFSFSGLKSAVLNYVNRAKMRGESVVKADVAASFQKAVVDVLVERSLHAVTKGRFALAGGVAANGALRSALEKACLEKGIAFYYPSSVYCTDNAAMIAVAGFYELERGKVADAALNAVPDLSL